LVGLLWNAWGWPPVVALCAAVALLAAAIAARFCRDTVPAPRIPPEGPV
jgi:hypothetical protein